MTEIDTMPAGREMDTLVGIQLFEMTQADHDHHGLVWWQPHSSGITGEKMYAGLRLWPTSCHHDFLPKFSTDLEASMLVLLEVGKRGYTYTLTDSIVASGLHLAQFNKRVGYSNHVGMGETLPLAINRAALKLVAAKS